MKIICGLDISICAVNLLTAQMWIKSLISNQKCNICIMIIDNTIFHQINMIFKQKSLMSKKYSHSCSSFTNVNSFSGKHNIEYSTHHSDRMYQHTFFIFYDTTQRFNPRQKSTFVQFHKILPKCEYPAPVIAFKQILSKSKQYS